MKTPTSANQNPLIFGIKGILITTLLITISLGTASAEKKSRNFFAPKGIIVTAPTVQKDGTHRIPIKFKTAIIHSAQWMSKVHSSVVGKEIHITADFRLAGGSSLVGRKKTYPGYIEPKGVAAGTYELKYLDPNGNLHDIGPVTLP
ncbi:hypothetical protein [Rubritalea profundi]|uniref:Uncharacterized protein n=1 Tax=Rubritalea profundi TaxID=1658618 RepID=A0A2S7TY66_9BACT|nr:hypothetical protein [Rubritalea profundi]PQJ27695.1 hypothetical protein BSZ32_03720 [Rubritalea profundi]